MHDLVNISNNFFFRWNIKEMDRLPEYVKPFYKALLELYEQFEQELSKEGRSYAAHYAIESVRLQPLIFPGYIYYSH